MAVSNQMYDKHISGANAITNAKNAKAAKAIGNATTDRGTPIRKSNTEFDKNSFLKILAAQLSNLDPTQNQDSSAYVAQMAQFASMEQMANLNTTMSDSAYQQMVGKKVIINEKDDTGVYRQGYVTEVLKKSGGTFFKMQINGKDEEIEAKNVIGVAQSEINLGGRAGLSSDFLAASTLANNRKNVVVAEVDAEGKKIPIKGKATGAYIDTVNGVGTKIKVEFFDKDGNSTTKAYNYGDIVSAGDLTEEEMDAAIEKFKIAQEEAAKNTSQVATNTVTKTGM